jgi:hypothetical protein
MPEQTALHTERYPKRPTIVISAETILNEIRSFFSWWYIEMPTWYIGLIQRVAVLCDDTFSISILIKTFFVPWRRDKSWIGHGFGIVIRILYLPLAIALTAFILAILTGITLLWALLPVISVIGILRTPFA